MTTEPDPGPRTITVRRSTALAAAVIFFAFAIAQAVTAQYSIHTARKLEHEVGARISDAEARQRIICAVLNRSAEGHRIARDALLAAANVDRDPGTPEAEQRRAQRIEAYKDRVAPATQTVDCELFIDNPRLYLAIDPTITTTLPGTTTTTPSTTTPTPP